MSPKNSLSSQFYENWLILRDLVLTETKKYEKTKNFFVFVCYKDREKRKLLTKIPIFVNFFLFSFVIPEGNETWYATKCGGSSVQIQ